MKNRIKRLKWRRAVCWAQAEVFVEQRDPHGIHDMGVEIQALDRAIKELKDADRAAHKGPSK